MFTTKRTMTTGFYGMTVGEMRKFLEGVDDETPISVSVYKADFRDPRESDQLTLSVEMKN